MPTADGRFKGIGVGELPWKVAPPVTRNCTYCDRVCWREGGLAYCAPALDEYRDPRDEGERRFGC